ncbi:MAG: type II secretion system protein [Planctomycetes bacterium]|nr:type II secretion system protein [Planctomycetota bacterium]
MIITLKYISKIKSRAFTLVELLVVISIISLLMAILMPTLSKVRRQSRAVKCLVNLHQWGLIWQMYTQDNDSYFPSGTLEEGWIRGTWILPLRSLYNTKEEIMRCPMATKREGHPDDEKYAKDKYKTYLMPAEVGEAEGEDCSYGANCWLYNFPDKDEDGAKVVTVQSRPVAWNWRTNNIRNASRIPVFGDCMWRGGGPYAEECTQGNPPVNEDDYDGYSAEMRHFCINRHDRFVNHLFMDSSARKVELKELWKLKWHRKFDTNGPWTNAGGATYDKWPDWMRKFSSY